MPDTIWDDKLEPARRASMLSSSIYHSTAQRNQPCTKQRSTYVPIRVRQWKQADSVGDSQDVVEHQQLAVFSKPTKISKTVRPKNETLLIKQKHKQLLMRQGFLPSSIPNLTFVHIRMRHACGVRVVALGHCALGVCKSLVCVYINSWTSLSSSFALFCSIVSL